MTAKAVEWAISRKGISSGEKLVLMMLANCINKDHEFAFPSQERIAEVTEKTVRHVRRCIKTLADAGHIRAEAGSSRGRGKGRKTTHYFLACDHITGDERAFTGGHLCPGVREQGTLTGGHLRPIQADIPVLSPTPPNIDNRNLEPELITTPKVSKAKKAAPATPKIAVKTDRGARLPDDWTMDDTLLAYCVGKGWSSLEARIINETFENYWRAQPGAKGRKLDWRATFRNWVISQKRWQIQQTAAAEEEARQKIAETWELRYRDWLRTEVWNREMYGPAPHEPGHKGPKLFKRIEEDREQGVAA